jgi:uncharacterized protein (DUF2235 family)
LLANSSHTIATHYRNIDPQTNRFSSEDPAEDDRNTYRVVENNSLNGNDPSGLAGYFFDGTGNSINNPEEWTNVVRLYNAYDAGLAFYAHGIGSQYNADGTQNGLDPDWPQGATGNSMSDRVDFMLKNLEKQLRAGDKTVDVFGFSRGSATTTVFLQRIQERIESGDQLYQDIEVRFVAVL